LWDLYTNKIYQTKTDRKMKTKQVHSMKAVLTILVVAAILTLVACGSGKENTPTESKQESEVPASVKAPSVDLHTAAFLGDMDAVRQHIQAGSDLDVREPTIGSSPLITAAVFGKTEVARALIEAGADVNLQNQEGSTALHSAAFLCRTEIVEMLLAHGADKSLKNIYGSTPLQSVEGPFSEVKAIYDEFSKQLGPMGLKLDYEQIEKTRPVIAAMLK
jgi:hypothetical protein